MSSFLVYYYVVLQLFLHLGVSAFGLHNFHENLVNVVVENFILGRDILMLVIEHISLEDGSV